MAQKRMFDKTITNDDSFLEMPIGSQVLYFHLSMNADDDGFINNWKSIMRMTSAKEDDLKVLIAKSYVIPFETGVIVIKHWKINNYLRNDRYKPTRFQEEYNQLTTDNNLVYQLDTNGIHSIDKNRIDKISIEKENNKRKFIKPTIEEIEEYCKERNNGINANAFYDFYESKDWYVGKNRMKDWKACIRTWEQRTPKAKVIETTPEWFDKELTNNQITKEEVQEIDNTLESIFDSIDSL